MAITREGYARFMLDGRGKMIAAETPLCRMPDFSS